MKKIAVCLPSYNEEDNIENITMKIDRTLRSVSKNYRCVIVNCDSGSTDKTNEIFRNLKTRVKKVSILNKEKGKGVNIISFMDYCYKNNIDYAFTFDADLTSFEEEWIYKILDKLKDNDFVVPIYKRRRYEGNTTNHLMIPLIYYYYGVIVRQPIGGDYGFNKSYIKKFQKYKTDFIRGYGIDIFMFLLALKEVRVSEVSLGFKRHKPSYGKMEKIFKEVLISFDKTRKYLGDIDNISFSGEGILSIDSSLDEEFYDHYRVRDTYNFKLEESNWVLTLKKYLNYSRIDNLSEFLISFKCYTKAYWREFKDKSPEECERQIYDLAYLLKEEKVCL